MTIFIALSALGGGRSRQDLSLYKCRWCSKKKMKYNSQIGRFKEIRNYRQHFKSVHSNIPFSEFLQHVTNRDKKYTCPLCRKQFAMSSAANHKKICERNHKESSSSSSSDSSSSSSNASSSSDEEGQEEGDPYQFVDDGDKNVSNYQGKRKS